LKEFNINRREELAFLTINGWLDNCGKNKDLSGVNEEAKSFLDDKRALGTFE
jgi:hypothetical protein